MCSIGCSFFFVILFHLRSICWIWLHSICESMFNRLWVESPIYSALRLIICSTICDVHVQFALCTDSLCSSAYVQSAFWMDLLRFVLPVLIVIYCNIFTPNIRVRLFSHLSPILSNLKLNFLFFTNKSMIHYSNFALAQMDKRIAN